MRLQCVACVLFLITLELSACYSSEIEEEFFGRVSPHSNRIIDEHLAEPETLDPTLASLTQEWTTIGAVFEGLVSTHPITLEPIAGKATCDEINAEFTRFTFYLRGHPSPRGTCLASTEALSGEFRRDCAALTTSLPCIWSDGRPATAHDFAFSWARQLNPVRVSPHIAYAHALKEAHALDDLPLQVDLNTPTPFSLKIRWHPFFAPLRHDVVRLGWATRTQCVSNGPLAIREWRPYEQIVLVQNPDRQEL